MFGKENKGKTKKMKLPDEGLKKFKKSQLDNLKEINKITSENNSTSTFSGDELDGEKANQISFEDKIVLNPKENLIEKETSLEDDLLEVKNDEIYLESYDEEIIQEEIISEENFVENVDDDFKEDIFKDNMIDSEEDAAALDADEEIREVSNENISQEVEEIHNEPVIDNHDAKSKNKVDIKLIKEKLNKIDFNSKFLDSLMIKTRILLGFMSIVVLILIVGIMVFSTISSMIKSQIPIIIQTENFKNKVFEMERVEKNFLLFEPSNIEFYKTGESKYVEEFKKGYEEALESFEVVVNSPIIASSIDMAQIEAFRVTLEEYSTEFLTVTDMIKVKGYGEYGKMGELKEASEILKKSVIKSGSKELEAEIYKVFLLESEYFRTNDEQIFKKIPAASSTFKNILDKTEISVEAKGEIRTGLTQYNSKIQLVNSLNKSVYNDRFGAITKYREKGNAIIDEINGIYIQVSDSAIVSLNKSRMSITTIIIVSVLLTFLVALLITKTIVKPINETKDLVKDIAEGEGDLSHSFEINGKNEMEQMKGSINIFISKIRDIIIGVKGTSFTLSESSNELSKAVEEANIHIEEVSNEVAKISVDLISTSNYVMEVNTSIADMANSSNIITEEARNVSTNSLEIIEAANRGSDLINQAAGSIDEVKSSSETVNVAISELQVHSREIGGIIDIIKGISDQTNLLALNASIEAARAGEHGRGFAVVADEVRNLSEETKKSTAKISDLIKKIEKVVNTANNNIKNEQDKVKISVSQTHKAKSEFAVILDMIKELSNKIEFIVSQSGNQNSITKDMANSISEILNRTEKNTESSARISESIESQVSIFEEIGASLEELSAMAIVLTQETDKFKV